LGVSSTVYNEAQASGECWIGGTLGGTSNIIWCNGAASNCSYKKKC
jgi:hypothetical protein